MRPSGLARLTGAGSSITALVIAISALDAGPALARCCDCDVPGVDLCLAECCESTPSFPECNAVCKLRRRCRRNCREQVTSCADAADPCRRTPAAARPDCRATLAACAGLSRSGCTRALRRRTRECKKIDGPVLAACLTTADSQPYGCHPKITASLGSVRSYTLPEDQPLSPDTTALVADVAVTVRSQDGAVLTVDEVAPRFSPLYLVPPDGSDQQELILSQPCVLPPNGVVTCRAMFLLRGGIRSFAIGVGGNQLSAMTTPVDVPFASGTVNCTIDPSSVARCSQSCQGSDHICLCSIARGISCRHYDPELHCCEVTAYGSGTS